MIQQTTEPVPEAASPKQQVTTRKLPKPSPSEQKEKPAPATNEEPVPADKLPENPNQAAVERQASKKNGDPQPANRSTKKASSASARKESAQAQLESETSMGENLPTDLWWLNNDANYGEAIVNFFGDRIRFLSDEDVWLVFENRKGWHRDTQGLLPHMVTEFAKDQIKKALQHLPKEKWGSFITAGNLSRVRNAIAVASHTPGVATTAEQVDSDPTLIGCQNGVLNLKTGEFSDFQKEHLVTRRLATAFDPAAKAPNFERFMEKVQPDPAMRRFLQRMAGYLLSGEIRDHALVFHYGTGANGKGTFLEHVLLTLWNDYGAKLTDSFVYVSKKATPPNLETAQLCGKRLALGEESQQGGKLNERLLKAISGGDRQKGRFHYLKFTEHQPTYKIQLVGNHLPRIQGTDDGIWRRFTVVHWSIQIPPGERDPKLKEKLKAELPGILNWCLEGYQSWDESGLNPPQSCLKATEAFREESDELMGFLTEETTPAEGSWIPKGELYQRYGSWADESGIKYRPSKNTLGGELLRRGWKEDYKTVKGIRTRVWLDRKFSSPLDSKKDHLHVA